MVETYKSQPIEERPSQKLGWPGYLRERAIGFIPLATALGAVAFGKLTKQKVFPLDGSPDIITKGWMMLGNKTAKSTTGKSINWKEVDLIPWFTAWYKDPEDKIRVTKNYYNFVKGFEFGAIPVVFHHWRKSEKKRLDLTSTYESLKEVNNLRPSDADLATENASLKQQLEFVRNQPTRSVHASAAAHEGTLSAQNLERQA